MTTVAVRQAVVVFRPSDKDVARMGHRFRGWSGEGQPQVLRLPSASRLVARMTEFEEGAGPSLC